MARRRTFRRDFKARVVLEDLTGVKSAAEICREHRVKPQVLARWKAEFEEQWRRAQLRVALFTNIQP